MYERKALTELPEHLFLQFLLSLGMLKFFFNYIQMKLKYVKILCFRWYFCRPF